MQTVSGLPQLDHLVEILRGSGNAHHGSAGTAFQALDEALGYLYANYEHELQFLEYRPEIAQTCDRILECFQSIRPIQAEVRDELSLGERETALSLLDQLRTELDTLFAQYGQLKSLMEAGPRYSELPFTQELLRVGHLYIENRLPIEAVQARLDIFCQYHDNLEAELEQMAPSPSEERVFQEHRDELEEAIAAQVQGIEDLDLALERESAEGILEAMDLLAEAGNSLVAVYKLLQKADQEPDTVLCFRCGTDNPAQSRLCGKCSAVLPRAEGQLTTSTMAWNEDGSQADQLSQAGEYLKIHNAVQEALASGQPGPLQQVLSDYRARLEQNRTRLRGFQNPPEGVPPEHLQVLEQGKQEFTIILEQLSAGLELLEAASGDLDPAGLQHGLEEIALGFERFASFQQTYQKAESIGG